MEYVISKGSEIQRSTQCPLGGKRRLIGIIYSGSFAGIFKCKQCHSQMEVGSTEGLVKVKQARVVIRCTMTMAVIKTIGNCVRHPDTRRVLMSFKEGSAVP